ncbi:hypothetical protein ACNQR9_26105 [Mycolicibacterium peregrinum]
MTLDPDGDTPNRTVRIPPAEWNAGLRAAAMNGEKLAAVIRRGIASYVAETDDDYHTEYRATSVTDSQLVVMGIAGDLAAVRRQFPTKYWRLESCRRSTYQPVR